MDGCAGSCYEGPSMSSATAPTPQHPEKPFTPLGPHNEELLALASWLRERRNDAGLRYADLTAATQDTEHPRSVNTLQSSCRPGPQALVRGPGPRAPGTDGRTSASPGQYVGRPPSRPEAAYARADYMPSDEQASP
jgi:hypothetical protein